MHPGVKKAGNGICCVPTWLGMNILSPFLLLMEVEWDNLVSSSELCSPMAAHIPCGEGKEVGSVPKWDMGMLQHPSPGLYPSGG